MDFVMEGFAKTTLFIQEVINKKRELISEFSLSRRFRAVPIAIGTNRIADFCMNSLKTKKPSCGWL